MARLLMPEDYGVVAMAMLIVGLIQTFLDFGATTALLRKEKISRDEIDSAWTLRVIQGFLAGVILILAPPLAMAYFHEHRLQTILWTFAACILAASLSSIGPVLAQKDFDFFLGFKIETTGKLASVASTLAGGLIFRDYRALVFGIVISYLTPLVLSYAWHPYRARWNVSKIGEIWSLTKWLLMANIGSFVLRKGDELIAGRIGTPHEYGLYNVGSDLGGIPVGEVGPAMVRALLPVLSIIQADTQRTREAVIKTISALNTVIWPIGLGFAAIAHHASAILLGPKWTDAVPFVATSAVGAVLNTSLSPARTLLTLNGHTRIQNNLVWIEFATFVCAALLLVPHMHLLGLAVAKLVAATISMFSTLIYVNRYSNLPIFRTLACISRPMVGSLLMAYLVRIISTHISGMLYQLIASVAFGFLFFSAWSLITWKYSGKPHGLESTFIEQIFSFRR